jgi:hypothetical protein
MLAALAVNAVFAARGTAASYAPPGGGSPVACVVILDAGDREAIGTMGRPIMRGNVLRVRKCELAAPAKGGVFTVGAEALTVQSDPRADDAARLIWSMTVA